ncbi:hypothetical protein LD13_gp159 [Bacillus phage Bobb]|uniref:Uncharacterized protein n=1 Tax=Bacillus phage Bobb TaxID=1527469 RepID=A0A076GDG8_9CAUD|nr:hypothetical protein LD13_gp159 [Bacillus phage Bobb]AII28060.1 hypothetical protein [Bacillus phage Bobb]
MTKIVHFKGGNTDG